MTIVQTLREPLFSSPTTSDLEIMISSELESFVMHVIEEKTTRCGEPIMIHYNRCLDPGRPTTSIFFYLKEDGHDLETIDMSPSHIVDFGVDREPELIPEAFSEAVETILAIIRRNAS